MHSLHRLLLLLFAICDISNAQQSAAGQDTVIGIVGRDFVMMGADSSSSGGGGIALTPSNIDKIAVIHDGGVSGDYILDGRGGDYLSRNDSTRRSSEQQAIAVGFAGDAADADRLMGTLKTHTQIREYEAGIGNDVLCVFDGQVMHSPESSSATLKLGALSPAGLDAEAIANLARNEIASRMRSRQPLQLCLLVGGMVRCDNLSLLSENNAEQIIVDRVQNQILTGSEAYKPKGNNKLNDDLANNPSSGAESLVPISKDEQYTTNPFLTPKLFWLDQYGSLQNMRFAAHGFGSNFAYSILDQRYKNAMSRQEAANLIKECFAQLRQRYVINSPQPPRIKCIDMFGVTEIGDKL